MYSNSFDHFILLWCELETHRLTKAMVFSEDTRDFNDRVGPPILSLFKEYKIF